MWTCEVCAYKYDEAAEGSPFYDLSDDWKCPLCNAGKEVFEKQG